MKRDPGVVSDADREAIIAVARDYLEGWIDGDAGRLGGSLHPDVRKRMAAAPASGSLDLDELDIAPWLARVGARGPVDYAREADIRVLDVQRGVATVAMISVGMIDYLHLARFGDRWLIVNVLYDERDRGS